MLIQPIKILLLTTSLMLTANLNAAESVELTESEVPEWRTIKTLMFGDRPIRTGKESAITLSINPDIDDASTVPIRIDGLLTPKNKHYIKTLHLIVDQNPIPTAAVFELSPTDGNLHLATRLRIEKFTFVRAVAETSDGQLHMDYKWVAVKGGCSAPSGKNAGSDPLLGKMKVTFNKYRNSYKNENGEKVFRIPLEQPNVVKVQVRHPNESALAADLDAAVAPNFIQELTVGFADENVLSAQVNFSISDNPAFTFSFSPKREGDLSLTVKDTHENTFTQSISVVKANKAGRNR